MYFVLYTLAYFGRLQNTHRDLSSRYASPEKNVGNLEARRNQSCNENTNESLSLD